MKRPRQSAVRQNAGPLALFSFVVNVTASFFRQFSRHISTWEKELNRRRQTLKPLENQGFFRLSLLYRNGTLSPRTALTSDATRKCCVRYWDMQMSALLLIFTCIPPFLRNGNSSSGFQARLDSPHHNSFLVMAPCGRLYRPHGAILSTGGCKKTEKASQNSHFAKPDMARITCVTHHTPESVTLQAQFFVRVPRTYKDVGS